MTARRFGVNFNMRSRLVAFATPLVAIFVASIASTSARAADADITLSSVWERPADVYRITISNDPALCSTLLAELNKPHRVARVPGVGIFSVSAAEDFVLGNDLSVDWNDFGGGDIDPATRAIVDLNNDGRPDTVLRTVTSVRSRLYRQFFWVSGKTPKDPDFPEDFSGVLVSGPNGNQVWSNEIQIDDQAVKRGAVPRFLAWKDLPYRDVVVVSGKSYITMGSNWAYGRQLFVAVVAMHDASSYSLSCVFGSRGPLQLKRYVPPAQ